VDKTKENITDHKEELDIVTVLVPAEEQYCENCRYCATTGDRCWPLTCVDPALHAKYEEYGVKFHAFWEMGRGSLLRPANLMPCFCPSSTYVGQQLEASLHETKVQVELEPRPARALLVAEYIMRLFRDLDCSNMPCSKDYEGIPYGPGMELDCLWLISTINEYNKNKSKLEDKWLK
jgi:hypothetical protein